MGKNEMYPNRINRGLSPVIAKVARAIFYVLCIAASTYAFEFVWVAIDKGQTQTEYAWEVVAQETLSQQFLGIPQMRITGGEPSRALCNFWNLEGIWGSCVTIGLAVRDYQPEYRPIVEREVALLVDQMRMPCRLLPTLGLANEATLAQNLGCKGWRKHFKLRIWVNAVTLESELGSEDRPNRWSLNTVKHLFETDFVEGDL